MKNLELTMVLKWCIIISFVFIKKYNEKIPVHLFVSVSY